MKPFIFTFLLFITLAGVAQQPTGYIGVRARYTASRTIDHPGFPATRENRLVLTFFNVTADGSFIPTSLSNYPVAVFTHSQLPGPVGGILDSTGGNYPGYTWTAPKVASYYSSEGPEHIGCDSIANTFTLNGHELDCGWVGVSYWDYDYGTGELLEHFVTPLVCLPYYNFSHPYFHSPGNINFFNPQLGGFPPTIQSFTCSFIQQFSVTGVLPPDSSNTHVVLAAHFAYERIESSSNGLTVRWSNLNETGTEQYSIERATSDNRVFQPIGTLAPLHHNGDRADYSFIDPSFPPHLTLYYRVKAVESNGTVSYSATVIHSPTFVSPQLQVYPNPSSNGQFHYRIAAARKGRYTISLIDVQGRVLRVTTTDHQGGTITGTLSANAGARYLIIRSIDAIFSQPLVTLQ
jgi:hypothetical protein